MNDCMSGCGGRSGENAVGGEYCIVARQEAGLRLDRWFRNRFPGLGHGQLAKLLRKGQIRLDGARVAGGARLAAGQKIRIPPLPAAAAAARLQRPRSLTETRTSAADREFLESLLLHRDDSVLVLNKPAGLAVQGGSGVHRHLDGMLAGLCADGEERALLTHRLDRDVSGVLVLGRGARAAAHLCQSFRERRARKLYWALTLGVPVPRCGEVRLSLAKKSIGGREKMTLAAGQSACTRYVVIEALASRLAWVAFLPESGRTHQLRVHAGALDAPILGDGKYGGAAVRRASATTGLASGLHLHARRLCLPHPEGGMLDVCAPLPRHMLESWRALGLERRESGGDRGAADDFALFEHEFARANDKRNGARRKP